MSKPDLEIAEKAFVRSKDFQGIEFVRRLKRLDDPAKQAAEVAVYFNVSPTLTCPRVPVMAVPRASAPHASLLIDPTHVLSIPAALQPSFPFHCLADMC